LTTASVQEQGAGGRPGEEIVISVEHEGAHGEWMVWLDKT
jgi:hypothetical protein